MNNEVKTQKKGAKILILVPLIMLIWKVLKTDFYKHETINYIICGALIVLIIIGSNLLKNILRKEKEQDI
ncbi:hypothetical protein H7F37_04250 [Winogradskyella sp. PAMC22761]|nr:hypothetical protein H7F37_04250 [Winogradskyella sp. PAMC22761]